MKTGRCALNGPWTNAAAQNIQRVLAAIGCLPQAEIEPAAAGLYDNACYDARPDLRVRLVLLGRDADTDIAARYAGITQVTWEQALTFMHDRFHRYSRQKAQTDQWDTAGRQRKTLALGSTPDRFFDEVMAGMHRGHAGVVRRRPKRAGVQP